MEFLQWDYHTSNVVDGIEGKWEAGPSMSTPRYRPGSVLLGSTWYMVGGTTSTAGTLATGESYDPGADQWISLSSDMCTPRAGLGLAVCDGRIIAIGGYNGGALKSMEAYDPREGKWVLVSEDVVPHPLDGPGLASAVYWNVEREVWIDW